jgi:hypothetical protein
LEVTCTRTACGATSEAPLHWFLATVEQQCHHHAPLSALLLSAVHPASTVPSTVPLQASPPTASPNASPWGPSHRCAKQIDQWAPAAVAALTRTAFCSLCFEQHPQPYVKLVSAGNPRFYCAGCKKPTFPCGSCKEAMAADAPAPLQVRTLHPTALTTLWCSNRDHPKADPRLGLEVSARWMSPSSRGLCGGDALPPSAAAAGNRYPSVGTHDPVSHSLLCSHPSSSL